MRQPMKIISIVLMLSLVAGFAWAYSSDEHVAQAPNGVGDVLIYPVYAADNSGWSTQLKIVNTSDTYSCAVKVVIREYKWSNELVDFSVFLSPSDEWTGELYWDNGTYVYSEDDSTLATLSGTFYSADDPLKVKLPYTYAAQCLETPLGYIEAFEYFAADLSYDSEDTDHWYLSDPSDPLCGDGVNEGKTIPKAEIFEAYNNEAYWFPVINIITGWFELHSPTLGTGAGAMATVLKCFDAYQEDFVQETSFNHSTENSVGEVEAALSKEEVYLPYYNTATDISVHSFTFPTKLTLIDDDCELVINKPNDDPEKLAVTGPFFFDFDKSDNYRVEYQLTYFDLEEHSRVVDDPALSPYDIPSKYFENEWNWIVTTNFIYDEGWAKYTFDYDTDTYTYDDDDLGYTGAPVIPLVLHWGSGGLELMYGSSHPGDVYVNDSYQPDYQWTGCYDWEYCK